MTSSTPHKRPTARLWYTGVRGSAAILLVACFSVCIALFVVQMNDHSHWHCDYDYVCYGYYRSWGPIWQMVNICLALLFNGLEVWNSMRGDKMVLRKHSVLGWVVAIDVVLFSSMIGSLIMGLLLDDWSSGLEPALDFTLLFVSGLQLAAMSFACRELRNRKFVKLNNPEYMKDVNEKLKALTEGVARLEQHAGTLILAQGVHTDEHQQVDVPSITAPHRAQEA